MSHQTWLTALARLSMLNAIALSLLGIQFLMPLAMIALIVILPAIFALQARLLPAKLWPLAGFSTLILALLFFGLDLGAWVLVYLILGMTCGLAQRIGWRRPVRVLLAGLVCAILLASVVLLFAWLVRLDWTAIASYLASLGSLTNRLPLPMFGLVGLLVWAMATGLGVDLLAASVFTRLRATQAGLVIMEVSE